MENVYLYTAGLLGICIAGVHGYLGEMRVVVPSQAPTDQAKRILHAIMVISAIYWFAAGLILLLTPILFLENQRALIAYGAAFLFSTGSLANFWATRGRHFGWVLLAIASGLAILGA